MCFRNFCHMLFIAPETVREYVTIEAGPDGKRISKRHKGSLRAPRTRGQQGIQVDFFLQEYYQSAGEPLPQVTQRLANSASHGPVHEDADIVQEVNGQWGPWLNKGNPLNIDVNAAPEELNPGANAFLEVMCQVICFPHHLVKQSDNTFAQAKTNVLCNLSWHCWCLGICSCP